MSGISNEKKLLKYIYFYESYKHSKLGMIDWVCCSHVKLTISIVFKELQ